MVFLSKVNSTQSFISYTRLRDHNARLLVTTTNNDSFQRDILFFNRSLLKKDVNVKNVLALSLFPLFSVIFLKVKYLLNVTSLLSFVTDRIFHIHGNIS